jgi:hypothetical protein
MASSVTFTCVLGRPGANRAGGAPAGKDRLRMAGAIGAGGFELVDQVEIGAAGAERAVDLQRLVGDEVRHGLWPPSR